MDRKKFESLVEEAVSSLPREFRKRIENLVMMVEDSPPRRLSSRASAGRMLLGLYHGVPLKDRGSYYGNIPPDVIVIYQEPIERLSATDDEIKERIREVVYHEVGHHIGLSEEELRKIEAEK
jgi:predicted Zn-dependent protease with MMP-like domain